MSSRRGIFRQAFEKREWQLNQAVSVLAHGWPGTQSASGVAVKSESAIRYSAVLACVRVLCEDVASLPLFVHRRLTPKGKERAPDHPLFRLLHDAPNPEQNSFQFRETMMMHLGLWGNAYAEIERVDGVPVALWPITPKRVDVRRIDGQLWYRINTSSDPTVRKENAPVLRRDQVFHVPGLSYDGIVGISPIGAAREAIGLGLAAEEFGSRFFSNDTTLGVMLEHPQALSDKAYRRLKSAFRDSHQGLSRAHRFEILEEGMKATRVGIPPEDAQFLETRKFQVREISRIYRMQPHKIGDLEQATFSNIEHQAIEHVVDTIRPWLVRWEQAIQQQLFTDRDRETFFAEFLVDGLLRGDQKSRYDAYAIARQWGWLSVNDIRELESLNPIDGGNTYLEPMNMEPVGAPATVMVRPTTNGNGREPVGTGGPNGRA